MSVRWCGCSRRLHLCPCAHSTRAHTHTHRLATSMGSCANAQVSHRCQPLGMLGSRCAQPPFSPWSALTEDRFATWGSQRVWWAQLLGRAGLCPGHRHPSSPAQPPGSGGNRAQEGEPVTGGRWLIPSRPGHKGLLFISIIVFPSIAACQAGTLPDSTLLTGSL